MSYMSTYSDTRPDFLHDNMKTERFKPDFKDVKKNYVRADIIRDKYIRSQHSHNTTETVIYVPR